MFIIAGLGNPEKKYDGTRHNSGFAVIDLLAKQNQIPYGGTKFRSATGSGVIGGKKVLLLKPLTYMNLSGEAIGEACAFYKIKVEEELIVISDDIDTEPGEIRVRKKGSAGGHNGLKNIIAHLGTDAFTRVRVGVGAKPAGGDLVSHVLGRLQAEEETAYEEGLLKAAEAFGSILEEGVDRTMNRFNHHRKQNEEKE